MSKKTRQIFEAIENLFAIQQKTDELAKNLKNRSAENPENYDFYKISDEISFQMRQNLVNLKFWFESLYSYNGKSTSAAKKQASKENGKKGGRPPKKIAAAKQNLEETENRLFQIEQNLKMSDDAEEIARLQNEQKILTDDKIRYSEILRNRENKNV